MRQANKSYTNYKGVSKLKKPIKDQSFQAYTSQGGKVHFIGRFKTAEDAA